MTTPNEIKQRFDDWLEREKIGNHTDMQAFAAGYAAGRDAGYAVGRDAGFAAGSQNGAAAKALEALIGKMEDMRASPNVLVNPKTDAYSAVRVTVHRIMEAIPQKLRSARKAREMSQRAERLRKEAAELDAKVAELMKGAI